jgi:5-methylcytosine-specific restriction protein A
MWVEDGGNLMPLGFERGSAYNRRQDIHARFGGQQQSGIITPTGAPVIFIISGKRGLEYGYDDRQHADGLIEYFGEGQKGDMTLTGGNKAIADHLANGKTLLFFEKEYPARHIIFKDEMICQGWHFEDGPDIAGTTRKAIVFELRPLDSVVHIADENVSPAIGSLDVLRARAFAAAKPSVSSTTVTRSVYERSADVRDYVLARSKGSCEGCGVAAPFLRTNGTPYLEPHHIRRVSDGGPDDPRFVIALCPNCHRRVHFGTDGVGYNTTLLSKMKAVEVN